ncbi:hypothetical protein SAMN02799631_02894 [Methylobacterium sp. 174MFSha1.1]|uniref:hypothetical protein n=1 Tax=Methylobacterium sp. 174MFSha1.1 TaxID=1502749 RepID=UPI0008E0DC54|nr:hypothetical protein [Methylobacterium sp. 174MFSha1.1]SFU88400.1 hypothetical protein SAMN02799631_02894 [Methylobacterium sp. 174MFSha1.1]
MPHFSADRLDALLTGDPAGLEALRALFGADPSRCTGCRPAPLIPASPAPVPALRPRRQAPEGRATKRRSMKGSPGPVSGTRGRTILRPPMPG